VSPFCISFNRNEADHIFLSRRACRLRIEGPSLLFEALADNIDPSHHNAPDTVCSPPNHPPDRFSCGGLIWVYSIRDAPSIRAAIHAAQIHDIRDFPSEYGPTERSGR
jgi:hypothetical protein